jgi:hypothetical protein
VEFHLDFKVVIDCLNWETIFKWEDYCETTQGVDLAQTFQKANKCKDSLGSLRYII